MIVEQIYTKNSLRNFNYIIASSNTKEAIVIDPLIVDEILDLANKKKYTITKIINTHDHHDHTEGNIELVKKTNAKVYCHQNALSTIPAATVGLKAGDVISLGDIKLAVLDTPGHTMAHVCILAYNNNSKPKAIFSGDTLFNAGAGNCYSGSIDALYNTFANILSKLPDEVLIYPGHDYLENNLNFTLSREPDNNFAYDLLNEVKKLSPEQFMVTTMQIEKQINTFFRLNNPSVINNLANLDKANICDKTVFTALRELRNKW